MWLAMRIPSLASKNVRLGSSRARGSAEKTTPAWTIRRVCLFLMAGLSKKAGIAFQMATLGFDKVALALKNLRLRVRGVAFPSLKWRRLSPRVGAGADLSTPRALGCWLF